MANNHQFSGVQPLQPPLVGSMDPPRSFAPPMPIQQYRPAVPAQQSQQFIPVPSPHFQPVGRGVPMMNSGMPALPPPPQFPQPMQQLPARPGQPGQGLPTSQPISLPNSQPIRHIPPGSLMPPPSVQAPHNYTPGLGGPGAPLSSSYTFAPYAQQQVTYNPGTQYQPMSQMHASSISAGGQPIQSPVTQNTAPVTPQQLSGEHSTFAAANVQATSVQINLSEEAQTDWKEHVSANGRRFYYNKKTRKSSWEKPFELMTPIERADASTDWKEFISPDGRKYYYNKATTQSTWKIPEELKLARERVVKACTIEIHSENLVNSQTPASVPHVDKKVPLRDTLSSTSQVALSSPVPVTPAVAIDNLQSQLALEPAGLPVASSPVKVTANEVPIAASPAATVSRSVETTVTTGDTKTPPRNNASIIPAEEITSSVDTAPMQDKQEADKDTVTSEKASDPLVEERTVIQEPVAYVDKLEAKKSFKALLESSNVGPDWTWDQAMRVIINDKRYGALKSLGEKKQAFNEYLGQKRKQEAEERRFKQKKTREEFKNMLEESKELTSSMRWSKAMALFENDERFKAVERERDRKDLLESYLEELGEKERVKAQEDRKRNVTEYRQFLESCDFIKANTQWRKVQDQLETDERCLRLDKIDRLEIFQDYLRDLEKEEEEQRRIQKEELRKTERKYRDDFRKLMEEHVAAGCFTAKTHWRDYYTKVKDLPTYLAVASNTSGSTPKDLFEDVAEVLEKQYHEDKRQIKDAVKLKKVVLASTWTFEEFKAAIVEDVSSVSDVNLKNVFEELLERAIEKEEKEAKKRKRLEDDFLSLLQSIKEITASSMWESCKKLFESNREFSSIGEERVCRDIFEEYTTQLREEAKEDERKQKEEKAKKEKERDEKEKERRKSKHRREKDRGYDREREHTKKEEADTEDAEIEETHTHDDGKRSGGESSKKQRKRHHVSDDMNESEKDRSKSSHRHSSDHKRSRRHGSTPESDGESRHRRHKREHRNGSRRSGDREELEDGEFGEDRDNQ